jgi:predicted amidohydrolase YtcJ
MVEPADMVLTNGTIFTVDSKNPRAEAIAIKNGIILKVGTSKEIRGFVGQETKVINLKGEFVMPGFVEGHGHFSGLGKSLMNLNFMKAQNWQEIVSMVQERVKTAQPGEWIIGRGWHQEKWNQPLERQVLGYPYHDELSVISPNNPVLLTHASGHSLFANAKAMELAGVSRETPNPLGGEVVRDSRGEAIGVFEETAMNIIKSAHENWLSTLSEEQKLKEWYKQIQLAEQNCLENGITSFQDAGASFEEIERYKKLAEQGELDVRLWSMISASQDNLAVKAKAFPLIGVGNNFFTVRAIKAYMDGALGAFGAWLLAPYEDKPNFIGQNVTPITEIKKIADIAIQQDLQLCTHAIGDRGNRMVLDIYEQIIKENPNKIGIRWRIEHAQHLDKADIPRFKELGVIASMQGVHCTSDAPYVVKRLGEARAKYGAYPWRSLIDAGAIVINGTDTPVEDISPIECFYASVTRRRANPDMVFYPEQSMTRQEAIYSYTLTPAYAAFEESIKGSLEIGKVADIVVLSNNLETCSEEEILNTKVLMTIVNGKVKYEGK